MLTIKSTDPVFYCLNGHTIFGVPLDHAHAGPPALATVQHGSHGVGRSQ